MSICLLLFLACAADSLDSGDGASTTDSGAPDQEAPLSMATARLPDAMQIDRLLSHLDALQAISDTNDDTRLAGLPGFDDSAAYVTEQLEGAGYTVTWQEFPHLVFYENRPPELAAQDAGGATIPTDDAFATMLYSGSGTVTADVVGVDLVLPPGAENSSTSGCESQDFTGFPAGAIALVQRGTCPFGDKARNAEAAGAGGVILFNEGQSGRTDVVQGTLGETGIIGIPVVGATFALGEALAAGGATATLTVDVITEERPVWNLWADLAGDPDRIVVVGAHLDSVGAGPGINDNGSGTSLVLELALQAAALGMQPDNTLRFAWWGAEEAGLIGSQLYVDQLSPEDSARHLANLNFDMVASPNGARFVHDGDDSEDLPSWPAPAGSAELEALFTDWFDAEGLSWEATAFDGRSDYGPFIWADIPAGGLFTGAEGVMSAGTQGDTNGTIGDPYDPCYHQACDTIDNLDAELFLDMARAAAWATEATGADLLDSPNTTARRAPTGPMPEHHAHAGCGGLPLR